MREDIALLVAQSVLHRPEFEMALRVVDEALPEVKTHQAYMRALKASR
jgi:hypothetical protein